MSNPQDAFSYGAESTFGFKTQIYEDIFVYLLEKKEVSISEISKVFQTGGTQSTKTILGEIKRVIGKHDYTLQFNGGNVVLTYSQLVHTHRTVGEILSILKLIQHGNLPKDITSQDLEALSTQIEKTTIRRNIYEYLSNEENQGKEVSVAEIIKTCRLTSKKVLDTLIGEVRIHILPYTGGSILESDDGYIFYTREKVEEILELNLAQQKKEIAQKNAAEKIFDFLRQEENIGCFITQKKIAQATKLTYANLNQLFPTVKSWLERSSGYTCIHYEDGYFYGTEEDAKSFLDGKKQEKGQALKAERIKEQQAENEHLIESLHTLFINNRGSFITLSTIQETLGWSKSKTTHLLKRYSDTFSEREDGVHIFVVKKSKGFFYGTEEQYATTKKIAPASIRPNKAPTVKTKLCDFIRDPKNHGILFTAHELASHIGTTLVSIYGNIKSIKGVIPTEIVFESIPKHGYIFGTQEVVESKKQQISLEKPKIITEKNPTFAQKLFSFFQENTGKPFTKKQLCDSLGIKPNSFSAHIAGAYTLSNSGETKLVHIHGVGYILGDAHTIETIQTHKGTVGENSTLMKVCNIFEERKGSLISRDEILDIVGISKNYLQSIITQIRETLSQTNTQFDLYIVYGKGFVYGTQEDIQKYQKDTSDITGKVEKVSAESALSSLFRDNIGKFFSKEDICTRLNISSLYLPQVIAKVKNSLPTSQQEEYALDFVYGKGYIYDTQTNISSHKTKKETTGELGENYGGKIFTFLSQEKNIGKIFSGKSILSACNIPESSFPSAMKVARRRCSESNSGYIIGSITGEGFIFDTPKKVSEMMGKKRNEIQPREWARTKLEPHRMAPKFRTSETNYTDKFKDIIGLFSFTEEVQSDEFHLDFVDKKIDDIALSSDEFFLGVIACVFQEIDIQEIKSQLGITYDDQLFKEYLIFVKAILNSKLKGIFDISFDGKTLKLNSHKQKKVKIDGQFSDLSELEKLIFDFCESKNGLSEEQIISSFKDEENPLGKILPYIENLNVKILKQGKKVVFLEDSKIFRVVALSYKEGEKKPNSFIRFCKYLEEKKGELITREDIMKELNIGEDFVRTLLARIRKKLIEEGNVLFCENINGNGYVYGTREGIQRYKHRYDHTPIVPKILQTGKVGREKNNKGALLFNYFKENTGKLILRDTLMKDLSLSDSFLNALLIQLRHNLEVLGGENRYSLFTVRGQGWIFGTQDEIEKCRKSLQLLDRKIQIRKGNGAASQNTPQRTSVHHFVAPERKSGASTFTPTRQTHVIPLRNQKTAEKAPDLVVADYAVPEFTEENIKRILDAHPDISLEDISFEKEEQFHFYLYLLTYRGKFISRSKLYEYLKLTPGLESELAIFQLKGTINNQLGVKQGNLHIQTGTEGFRIASNTSKDTVEVTFEGQKDSFIISKEQRSITYIDGGKSVTIPELNQEAFDVLTRLIESKSHTVHMGRSGTSIGEPIDKILFRLNIPYLIKRVQAEGKLRMIHKSKNNQQNQKPEKASIQA